MTARGANSPLRSQQSLLIAYVCFCSALYRCQQKYDFGCSLSRTARHVLMFQTQNEKRHACIELIPIAMTTM